MIDVDFSNLTDFIDVYNRNMKNENILYLV